MKVGNRRAKDYPDHVRMIRKISKPFIVKLLKNTPLHLPEIINEIKNQFPENCDDSILCACGVGSNHPEWKHQTRWALYDLKNIDKIQYEKTEKLYSKFKK